MLATWTCRKDQMKEVKCYKCEAKTEIDLKTAPESWGRVAVPCPDSKCSGECVYYTSFRDELYTLFVISSCLLVAIVMVILGKDLVEMLVAYASFLLSFGIFLFAAYSLWTISASPSRKQSAALRSLSQHWRIEE